MTPDQRQQQHDEAEAIDAIGRIAWTILAIADIEDHAGEDPIDNCRRDAIRRALEAAYAAGQDAGQRQDIRARYARDPAGANGMARARMMASLGAAAALDDEREATDDTYGTIGGGR